MTVTSLIRGSEALAEPDLNRSVPGRSPAWAFVGMGAPTVLVSCPCSAEVADPDQVVPGRGEDEIPVDFVLPPMADSLHPADGLQPSEDLLHPFADTLADGIAGVPGRPPIDGTGAPVRVLRHVRRDVEPAHPRHEVRRVESLVGSQGEPSLPFSAE